MNVIHLHQANTADIERMGIFACGTSFKQQTLLNHWLAMHFPQLARWCYNCFLYPGTTVGMCGHSAHEVNLSVPLESQ